LLTAATAIQIAIALIVLTRPSRDDVDSAEPARRATVSAPGGDEQSAAPARTLPFAVRKEGFYRRGAAGSRPRARGKFGGSPTTKVDRPKPRLARSPPPPPPPRATTATTADNPPPPSSETTNAAGRPPPQTVARNAAGGEDEDDDDEEEEEEEEEEEDEGDDDDGGDGDGDGDDGDDGDDGGGEDDD
jgi:hypothetical protein